MSLFRGILVVFVLLGLTRCGVVGAPKNYVDVYPETRKPATQEPESAKESQ